MRVAIATVQVPYLMGGAEALADGLRVAIASLGHPVEIVTLPFRFFPPGQVRRAMQVWEEEDFSQLNLYEPDRVVCLKFPAYGLKHPAKSLWLCHQHRSAYELFSDRDASPEDKALRDEVRRFDARHLREASPQLTISRRVSERLKQFCGIDSSPLYHPPPMAERHYSAAAQPYVLFPSRIEHAKRQDLLVRAMKEVRGGGFAVFAGEGGQIEALRRLAQSLGVSDRVRILGRVTAEELLSLYAHAAAVCFVPKDEDYGYVTLEAMLSSKPVITCDDSGGPLEFVVDGETGRVVVPEPTEIARAIDQVFAQPSLATRLGRAGLARYRDLVPGWHQVAEAVLASPSRG